MLKVKKIFVLGLLSEIIYISFLCLEIWRRQSGSTSLTITNNYLFFLISGLLIIAFSIYIFASPLFDDKKNFKIGIVFFTIFSFTTLSTPPLTSIDAYTYIHTSRVLSVHHTNPYLASYDDFADDQFASLLKNCWSNSPTLYAPVFTIISTILTFIGQKSFWFSIYLFKILFALINIVCCYLVYKITKSRQATLLYAWNPLILFEFGVNAHNDILTIFFLLLCLLYALKKKFSIVNYSLGLVFLLCATLIKFMTAFFLPIYFFIAIRQCKDNKERLKLFYHSCFISASLLFVFYLPFWQGWETFSRIIFHANHVYSAWFFSSPIILLFIFFFEMLGFKNFTQLGAVSGKYVFIFSYLALIIRLFKQKNISLEKNLVFYFLACLSFFYASFFTWLMPWYFSCLILLLILSFSFSKNKHYLWASHALTLYGILYYIILR